jgi:hypothetical protein
LPEFPPKNLSAPLRGDRPFPVRDLSTEAEEDEHGAIEADDVLIVEAANESADSRFRN